MSAAQIAMRNVQPNCRNVIIELLREAIGEASKLAAIFSGTDQRTSEHLGTSAQIKARLEFAGKPGECQAAISFDPDLRPCARGAKPIKVGHATVGKRFERLF